MAETTYKFDYTEPENVESQVPGTQKLREDLSDSEVEKSTEWDENKIENREDYVLSPVVTVTKNEVTLSKGDMKLQKVTVTENVSEIRHGVFHTIKAPAYPPIYSEIIPQSPIRMDPNSQSEPTNPNHRPIRSFDRHTSQPEPTDRYFRPIRSLERQTSQPEERKTRIPTRFKNAVNRVRRDRSMPAKKVQETIPTHPRRSSIPRLKPKTAPAKVEDEFERLYGEIASSPADIDLSLLNNKVEDPEKVEDIFEEIIHAYDDGETKPIVVETPINTSNNQSNTVEKPKSKIPMLKRKSEAEIEVPKSVTSSKSSPVANSRFKDAISKFSRANEEKPSKRTVTKRVNGDNNNVILKTSHRKVQSASKDGQRYEIQMENVEQVSSEQDISPDNVVNFDDVEARAQSTIEIVEITPTESVDITNEMLLQPYTVETVDSPSTSIIEEIHNSAIEIEEANESEPKAEVNKGEDLTAIKAPIEPVKVISADDFQKLLLKHPKQNEVPKPVVNKNRNIPVENNGYEIGNYAREISMVKTETIHISPLEIERTNEHNDKERKPVLRRDKRYDIKKEETNGDNDIVVQPKSVLSKIAMFEKHRQDDSKTPLKPKPAVRCGYRRKLLEEQALENTENTITTEINNTTDDYKEKLESSSIPTKHREKSIQNDAVDIRKQKLQASRIPEPQPRSRNINPSPVIVSKVLHPIEPNSLSNQTSYQLKNEEINNNVIKSENFKISRMEMKTEEVAVSLALEENVVQKETASEIKEDNLPVDITAKDRVKRHQPNRYYSFEVDYAQEKPVTIENAVATEIKSFTPVEMDNEPPVTMKNAVETEINSLTPSKIEYIEQTSDIQPKNDDKLQDPVVVSHIYKSSYIDDRETKDSPFDFTPKPRDYKGSNYKISPTMSSEEILNTYRAKNEDHNLRKAKSVAELDLGDAVKGKVKDLIVRMKSVDQSVEKKQVISAKERPRKKSVSEKIALFEEISCNDYNKIRTSASGNHPPRVPYKGAFVFSTFKHVDAEYTRQEIIAHETKTEAEYKNLIEELERAKQTYGRTDKMATVTLNNGEVMPVLAVGTALLDPRLAAQIIATAIDLGYRAIDTAFIYGNEKEVGEGIRRKIDDGTVKRSDLFIISKLWSTFHRRDLVEQAHAQSLQRLGLDYVDLYLIHNPMSFKEGGDPIPKIAQVVQYSEHDYLDAWYGMEDLVSKGLVKSIGLSNFNSSQVQKILDKARIKPVVNQVECHPYLSQHRLYNFCDERNIKLSCFGVLGSKGTPPEYKNSDVSAIDDPMVKVMAAGLKVSPAQLLIRYQLQSDHAVVVKASTGAHMWDNLQALTFELSEGQMDALRALNRNKRTFAFKGMGDTHKNYPFNAPF